MGTSNNAPFFFSIILVWTAISSDQPPRRERSPQKVVSLGRELPTQKGRNIQVFQDLFHTLPNKGRELYTI